MRRSCSIEPYDYDTKNISGQFQVIRGGSDDYSYYIDESSCHNSDEQSILTLSPEVEAIPKRLLSRNLSIHDYCCVETDVIRSVASVIYEYVSRSRDDDTATDPEFAMFDIYDINLKESASLLDNICSALTRINGWGQLPYDCLIIALIYLQRLSRLTNNRFRLSLRNWRSSMLVCMVLASKIWDDTSMTNGEFALLYKDVDLILLNALELKVLQIFDFNVQVSLKEYDECHGRLKDMIFEYNMTHAVNKLNTLTQRMDPCVEEQDDTSSAGAGKFEDFEANLAEEQLDGYNDGVYDNVGGACDNDHTHDSVVGTYDDGISEYEDIDVEQPCRLGSIFSNASTDGYDLSGNFSEGKWGDAGCTPRWNEILLNTAGVKRSVSSQTLDLSVDTAPRSLDSTINSAFNSPRINRAPSAYNDLEIPSPQDRGCSAPPPSELEGCRFKGSFMALRLIRGPPKARTVHVVSNKSTKCTPLPEETSTGPRGTRKSRLTLKVQMLATSFVHKIYGKWS